MVCQFAFLCDAVNIAQNNLFNVLGGGIESMILTQLPKRRPFSLLMRIEYSAISESGNHRVEVRLVDADGKDRMPPVSLEVSFPREGRFFNLISSLNPQFEQYGTHSIEIAVDRHTIATIPINVVAK